MSNLVLSRKVGECVKIGDTGLFKVLEIHPAKVYVSLNNHSVMLRIGNAVLGEDPDIKITLSSINKGCVKFLFDADRSVSIVRSELLR